MKKHAPKEAERLVVAVPSITPEFNLWNSVTQTLTRVYGGNLNENSVYIRGSMPKSFRMAAEDMSDENELNLLPLPDTIEEVVLSENPECQLLITNCTVMQMPQVKDEPQTCKVIEHPAAWFAKAKKLHQVKRKDDNQLFLFPPPNDLETFIHQKLA